MKNNNKVINLVALCALPLALVACGGGSDDTSSSGSPVSSPTSSPTPAPTASPSPVPATPVPTETPEPVAVSCFDVIDGQYDASLARLAADFPIGVSVPAGDFDNSILDRECARYLIEQQFSQLSAENIMKPSYLHPEEARYFFDDADELVDYALSEGKTVHGHTLLWHTQAPQWMENFEGTKQDWLDMVTDHVTTIVSHYDERIVSWDVVNEVISDNESETYRDSFLYQAMDKDFIAQAYTVARAADADSDLYYNDYNISGVPGKRARMLTMVDELIANEVPIDGIGFQMHINIHWPSACEIETAFSEVVSRGLKVKITELDIAVNPDEVTMANLSDELAQRQREKYREVVSIYRKTVPENLRGGITVWGLNDSDSWLRGYLMRDDWPLLFNDDYSPKPAYEGFIEGLQMTASDCL